MIIEQIFQYTPRRIFRGVACRVQSFAHGIGSQFVNYYFGNTSGWRANVGAISELSQLRNTFSGCSVEANDAERAASLEEDGYVLLERVSPRDLVQKVVATVSSGFDLEAAGTVRSPNGFTQFYLCPVDSVPRLRELLEPRICKVICAYYKTAIQVKTVRVWRNHHVPNVDGERHEVFSNTFHHDNTKVTGLRIFILLNDGVTKNTGAFRFHDRKTSEGLIRSFGYFHRFMQPKRVIRRLTDPKTLRFFEGNAGDVAIVNTQQCLHAASVPKEPGSYRDILQFEVYPAEGPYNEIAELLDGIPEDTEIYQMRQPKASHFGDQPLPS